jgi:hypothetical protein
MQEVRQGVGKANHSWIFGGDVLTRDGNHNLTLNGNPVQRAYILSGEFGGSIRTRGFIEYRIADGKLERFAGGKWREQVTDYKPLIDVRQVGYTVFLLDIDGDLWLHDGYKLASGVARIINAEGRPWFLTYESNGTYYGISQFLREPIVIQRGV